MSETASFREPVYWRIGEGDWHEDPLTDFDGGPVNDKSLAAILRGDEPLWSMGGYREGHAEGFVGWPGVEVRRDVPPTGEQCAKCRAAKAAILEEAEETP